MLDADWSADADAASDADNPYRFTARRLDAETGLIQYRNRCYSVAAGRFISRDPEGYTDEPNLYVYIGNSPIAANDPSGLKREEEWRPFSGKIEWNVRWITVRNYPSFINSMEEAREYLGAPEGVSLPPLTEQKRVSNWVQYSAEIHMWCEGMTPHIGAVRNFTSNAPGWDSITLGVPVKGFVVGYQYKRWAVCKKTNSWPGPQTRCCQTQNEVWTCRSYKRHSFFGGIAPPLEGEWPRSGKVTGSEKHHFKKTCCCCP